MNIQYEVKNYLNDQGQLTVFPAKKSKQKIALFYLASKLDADKNYSEKEINSIIDQWHTYNDSCTLRRELYNNRFINRANDGSTYYKEAIQPTPSDFGIDDSFSPNDILNGFKLELKEYRCIRLTKKHRDDIYNLEKSNTYYYDILLNHSVTPEESLSDIDSIPEGFPRSQKFFFGIYQENQLIAVIDYLVGYNLEHTDDIQTLWIGFFMVHKEYQRSGIGQRIIDAFIHTAKENTIHKIQLACIEGNEQGIPFWSSFGFKELTHTTSTLSNNETRNVIVMELLLD